MRCARREAGPPEPAAAHRGRARKLPSPSSGLTGGRLAAPAGPRRAASAWRGPALLPVLALVLGALGLFAAAPAQAQSQIWSATLTVDEDDGFFGCDNSEATQDNCSSSTVLSEDEFTYNGANYKVVSLYWDSATNRLHLVVHINGGTLPANAFILFNKRNPGSTGPDSEVAIGRFATLTVDGTPLAANDATTAEEGGVKWSYDPATDWTDNQQVAVRLAHPSLGRAGSMSTPGLYPLGPGRLKIAEGTSITYPIAIDQPPTADLTITPRHHNVRPDGSDYPQVDNGLLTIHNAVTFPAQSYLHTDWMNPKSVRLTAVDDNECKSPPGTRYWIRHHGSGGGPDWGGWDRQDRHHGLVISIEIIDDDCKYLAASPGQVSVEEGGSATYTVRLKEPLGDAAYISPRVSVPGDSDPGAIAVSPGRVRVEAGDTGPITFTVSAGRDADSRNEVLVVDHGVDSPEVPADYLGARVTVIVQDPQNAARTQERDPQTVTGLALAAGSGAVALSPAFSTDVLSYRASVPAGTARVTLAPRWDGGASVFAGSRRGGTTFTRPARVRPSGTAVELALAPDGGATELWVMAGGTTTYRIEVTGAPAAAPAAPAAGTPEEGTPPGSGEEGRRGPPTASDGEDAAPGEHGGGVPPGHGGAPAAVPGVPGPAAEPGRGNRRAQPPVIGRRARAIGSPYCFVPGAAELGALGESARLAYRLDSARDFDLCLWAPDPNWRDAPAYASCRGAGGALPEHASPVRGAGREEISVERAPGLMACVVPAEAAAGGGAWRLRIAPDNPDNTGTEDTE